jgi:hypothetical protein
MSTTAFEEIAANTNGSFQLNIGQLASFLYWEPFSTVVHMYFMQVIFQNLQEMLQK